MKVDESEILYQVSKLTGEDVTNLRLLYQKTYIVLDDATTKAIVYANKKPVAFVLVSSARYPNTLLDNNSKVTEISGLVGKENAKRILIPDVVDVSNGISYSITKYHARVSANYGVRFLQKRILGVVIIRWLTEILKFTHKQPNAEELEKYFVQPLKLFSQDISLKPEHKALILSALKDIEGGLWLPRLACAHNDLWLGNVLLKGFLNFTIIDWGGSSKNGYPFYDFIRVSDSFQLHKIIVKPLLRKYCEVIGCSNVEQIKYYIAVTFAMQSQNLGQWSHVKCLETLDQCVKYIDRVAA